MSKFWTRWLEIVGWILVAFGLCFAILNRSPFFDLIFNRNIDPVFWGGEGMSAAAGLFQAWIYGVLGATIAGWGVCIALLAKYPLRRGERWAWRCLTLGLGLWFVVDTGLSASSGVTFNVVFNCLVAGMVFLPLWQIKRDLLLPRATRSSGESAQEDSARPRPARFRKP